MAHPFAWSEPIIAVFQTMLLPLLRVSQYCGECGQLDFAFYLHILNGRLRTIGNRAAFENSRKNRDVLDHLIYAFFFGHLVNKYVKRARNFRFRCHLANLCTQATTDREVPPVPAYRHRDRDVGRSHQPFCQVGFG